MTVDTHPSTHPPLPPTTEDDRLSWLRLLRSRRVGVSTFFRLMAEHNTAQAALAELPAIARAAGVDSYQPCSEARAAEEMAAAHAVGARLLLITDADYPDALRTIPDPPPLLWMIGDNAVLRRPMVALVGARYASSLGTRMARQLSAELAEAGFVIVSGLARGVDTAAHLATLHSGTVAVMGGGVDVLYPSENAHLAREIEAHGLRLSEQPMGLSPQARHFPRRNRIISGLSGAVVVVEAAAKSGSLITARNALDQGREVLAVPGHPMDGRASGCNMLIRDGARLVRNAADVIEALPVQDAPRPQPQPQPQPQNTIPTPPPDRRSLAETARLHNQILDRLGPSPLAEDQLIRDLGQPAHAVSPVLVDLELDGRIKRDTGGLLSLATAKRAS
ncbi:DNA-protecting protein DprA [Roseovarius faecimaris]|uniref:DNA-protecting protein DprA n=1 Tax=Roseovarius faecimaris TaxID=2494550 RepID=A0A6I6IP20_9RHOB|nr:DNA-processing protein DprA [Roseovarius faecimaris]QGX97551.1 DNA-protecting protein DprA [Roseovarius faecimaris]